MRQSIMEKRKLGTTNLEVGRINFGGNVFGWTLTEKESFDILDQFIEGGYNFIDTADNYSAWVDGHVGGESETIIGNWMKERKNRDQIVLATKVGGTTNTHGIDVSKKHIIAACDASLKRLKTDYIDLYYTHFDNIETPIEETLSAYQELIKAGKVRYIGVSNLSPTRLINSIETAKKKGLPQYQVLQPHYNLIDRRQYEVNYAPLAEKYQLAVLPYFSLASGFLTGKYQSKEDLKNSKRSSFVKDYLNEKNFSIIKQLKEVADKYQTQPAVVALAWLLNRPNIAAPIVSATSKEQLNTLFEAPRITIEQSDFDLLTNISRPQ